MASSMPAHEADGSARPPGGASPPATDRWDLAVLAAIPFLAVMVSCAASALDELPGSIPDVTYYARVGEQFASGLLPYRDVPFEYPPLAAIPMALPELLWPGRLPGLLEYQWLWALMTGLAATGVGLILAWIASRPGSVVTPFRALLAWALIAIIETPLIAWRYDIIVVVLCVGAVALVLAGRPMASGLALAGGTLLKLFPAVLVPILVLWLLSRGDRRSAIRLSVVFGVATVAVLGAVVAVVGLEPAMQFVRYQQDRLVQIESLAASVALVGHLFGLLPVIITYGFQSLQVEAPGLGAAAELSTPLLILAAAGIIALVAARFWSERESPEGPSLVSMIRGIAATIIVLLLTNKVFSAQYVLWMLPFACLLPRREAALAVGIAVLSILVFPLGYAELAKLHAQAVLVLAARNVLLLVLLVRLLIDLWPATGRQAYGVVLPWSRRERTSYTR
jgi:hypothetical protein